MHTPAGSSSGVPDALRLALRSWIACLMGDVLLKSGMGGGAESPACFAAVAMVCCLIMIC